MADERLLYSPLASDSIRLLDVLDDTGLNHSLATFRLREAPPFIALSYTWGKATYQKGRSPDLEYAITLNVRKVLTQQNLHDALTTLAKDIRKWRAGGHRLWVDFLCINQSDLDERGHQVRLMKQIYEKSAVVFAWLGLPYDERETELAVKWMRSFNEYLYTQLQAHDNDIGRVLAGINSHSPGFPSTEDSDEWTAWMGITEMMANSYWSRTWIYQEATTPGPILFYCGRKRFDDFQLSATSAFATRFSRCAGFDSRFSTSVGAATNMDRLNSARITRGQDRERMLIDLLYEMRDTDCTDPRDKIYAQLGHAADVDSDKMAVEYAKDVKTVYGDLARSELSTEFRTGLRLLEYCFTPTLEATNKFLNGSLDPSWPSWIPDWRQRSSLGFLCPFQKDQPHLFDPAPGCKVEIEFREDVMSVRGGTLDNTKIAQLTQISDRYRDLIDLTQKWATEMAMIDISGVPNETFRRCLVADISPANRDAEEGIQYTRGYTLEWDKVGIIDGIFQRLVDVCQGRRMGRTSDGALGIFPAAAQHGDIVSVFYGGHVLYLLRPIPDSDDHFRYIGPCYVDGLMDGKALRYNPRSRMLHIV